MSENVTTVTLSSGQSRSTCNSAAVAIHGMRKMQVEAGMTKKKCYLIIIHCNNIIQYFDILKVILQNITFY